jgi:autotransporter strand-loop-strand O-heptosyltransferase
MKKTKILYLMSHISTGGMPQFVLKRIQTLLDYTDSFEIFVAEYDDYGKIFPVQRNQIMKLVGDNFYSLGENKMRVMEIVRTEEIDIVHLDEMPESMNNDRLFTDLYRNDRKWRIVETCHTSSFKPHSEKRFHPDLYAFCTPWHESIFAGMDAKFVTIPYPIDYKYDAEFNPNTWRASRLILGFEKNKTHVINVGLWTPGKNQKEGIEIARKYPDMMFHFIGNQAGNFEDYWRPLINDLPDNVKVWGERTDISTFMEAADIFMFNSTFELNPLVLREAIGHSLPIVARNLPQYAGMYDDYINPIDTDLNTLKCDYKIPTDNTSLIFGLRHEETYNKLLELPVKEQKPVIIQHYVDQPYLEIKGINLDKKDDEAVSIVLAHPNNEFRKELLKNCLKRLNTNIILSANYPIEEDTQALCDYVIYTKENPLLYQDEFKKYNVAYYHFHTNEKGEKVYELFEKEHGYCVYMLMRNGVEYAKKLGYKKVNIINYDYEITRTTINENLNILDTDDFVIYKYGNNSYEEDSYCTAFFSAKTDAIHSFITKFKDKEDYYTNGPTFNILEIKFYKFLKESNFKIRELLMTDLKKNNKVDVEGIDYTNDEQKNKVILDKRFYVEYYDDNGVCVYNNHIDANNWVKLNRKWFTNWKLKIWDEGKLIHENTLNYEGKRVFITLESKSLGDTIAWIPYALEFKKKHNCHVIVSTFWNYIFDYPELEFSEPGKTVDNVYGLYRVGWFYDENKEPEIPHTIPMQKSATNILGLEYKEIKPKLKVPNVEKIKQVVIAIHSTAQAKYWNNPTGWQEVVDYLISKGYVVKLLSKEGIDYMGNIAPNGVVLHPDGSIESVMEEMLKSELFIGIGSGLSWLSWALDVPTMLISGFSEPFAEMEGCIRVSAPEGKCSGCFNRYRLNPADWNWCPDYKDTDRQFECTKSITGQMVIDKIKLM